MRSSGASSSVLVIGSTVTAGRSANGSAWITSQDEAFLGLPEEPRSPDRPASPDPAARVGRLGPGFRFGLATVLLGIPHQPRLPPALGGKAGGAGVGTEICTGRRPRWGLSRRLCTRCAPGSRLCHALHVADPPMVASTAVLAGTTAAALRLGGALLFYSVMPRKPRVPSIPEKPTGRAKKPEPSGADAQARPAQPNLWDFFTPDTAVGEPIEPTPPRPTTAKPARRRSRIP